MFLENFVCWTEIKCTGNNEIIVLTNREANGREHGRVRIDGEVDDILGC